MSDRFIYSCRECGNAVVDTHRPLKLDKCPACGKDRGNRGKQYLDRLFKQEGQIA